MSDKFFNKAQGREVRAAVYGAGAMGTALGAFISNKGFQIDLVSHNKEHIEALRRDGAHVIGSVGMVQEVTAILPEEMTGKYDLIFLMTKQRNNAEICRYISNFLAEDGVVCTMQNGLPEPSVSRELGAERCLGCAVSWGATKRQPGVVEITSDKKGFSFALGSIIAYDGIEKKLELVKTYLECMGTVTVEENFIGARWAKLAINSAFSSLSALTGLTFGEIAKGKTTKRLALGLLNEAFNVAEKCGVKIGNIQGHDLVSVFSCREQGIKRQFALLIMPLAMKRHKKLVSGMYFDLRDGRKSDIDHINGLVARAGRKFSAPTPLNVKVLELAHKIERGEARPSIENIGLLLK